MIRTRRALIWPLRIPRVPSVDGQSARAGGSSKEREEPSRTSDRSSSLPGWGKLHGNVSTIAEPKALSRTLRQERSPRPAPPPTPSTTHHDMASLPLRGWLDRGRGGLCTAKGDGIPVTARNVRRRTLRDNRSPSVARHPSSRLLVQTDTDGADRHPFLVEVA